MKAEQIYEVLTKRTFEDFYNGPFIEHITELDHNPPSKEFILNRISQLFNLPVEVTGKVSGTGVDKRVIYHERNT